MESLKDIDISGMRYKLEASMNQVTLLTNSITQLTTRLRRAHAEKQKRLVYLYQMQLATTKSVMEMYREYMVNVWHKMEGIEDHLIDHGWNEEDIQLFVWGEE